MGYHTRAVKDPTVNTTLPRLDRLAIAAEQQRLLPSLLPTGGASLDRLAAIAALMDDWAAEARRLARRRDKLGLSLAIHDGMRAVNTVMGVSRTGFFALRCAVDPATVPHVKNAAAKLPEIAAAAAALEERYTLARAVRDSLVHDLLEAGHSRPEIAEAIGRNPSRISHIKAATGASA